MAANPTADSSRTKVAPNWRDVVAGIFAGIFSRTVTAPIERVKLLVQLQGTLDKGGEGSSLQAGSKELHTTKMNAWQCAKHIYQSEGILSFWRGNLPSVIRVSGTAAINFTMMNYYKQVAVRPFLLNNRFVSSSFGGRPFSEEQLERRRKNVTSLVAGGMAGGTATTVLYPVEFLRTRLAADLARGEKTGNYKFKGMRHAFMTILRSDGPMGFYQGYGIALLGGVFYRILFLGGHDVMKSEWEHRNALKGKSGLDWGERIGIAQIVSLSAGTLSYPFDSVRRRLMMQAGTPFGERRYLNSIDCIRKIAAQEGSRGFFLGLGANVFRSVSGAFLLVAYDAFKDGLK